ncbi:methyltransferase domain-containing protein [Sediminibacterium sp.]|uniref:methyltransferase domain-containing protein n=1 Tax=Sediminibacterium sp. TaxID=1917865 RepID=UPI0027323871|nr:methyltransferase domain-containing protein [Sediminibacterium sp.]MDP3392440.1 methyltransferase domain-containing protein [Sediminibacterium sp.]MDP3565706.1 methyltransferase domain-containing protein [Sediminibacterium sp.]
MGLLKLWVNHQKEDSFVNQLRKKRFALLKDQIEQLIAQKGHIKILDIGGETDYWKYIGWKNEHCTIYLLNLSTAPGQADVPGFVRVTGSALELPFEPGDVDLIFSNSVIEHVGSYANQSIFAKEVRRVCHKYIIQTPSWWFPLEPHSLIPFFQYLPHAIRAFLIMRFNINYFPKKSTYQEALAVSHSTLMFTRSRFQQLFPEATLHTETLFGIPKSYTVVKMD